ncbi:MAG: flagellar basal body L-ring protein FlgH [Planctomycetes bacterium]|nr:flagellar basal body L-ring protein FlgH [Planctomycetota bacterium]
MARALVILLFALTIACPTGTFAQTSSLGERKRKATAGKVVPKLPRENAKQDRNYVYEQHAWTALPPTPPKLFKPGDLITVIVREQRKFEADADLQTKKQFDAKSELNAFVKATGGGLGAAAFRRGKPTIDYKYDHKIKNEADTSREDKFTTRLTAAIIDVKPNGVLVLEARARIQHDDETSFVTLTGNCRKEDVSADNTVLSTQIADKNTVIVNSGALKAAATRGWIPRILDLLRPI